MGPPAANSLEIERGQRQRLRQKELLPIAHMEQEYDCRPKIALRDRQGTARCQQACRNPFAGKQINRRPIGRQGVNRSAKACAEPRKGGQVFALAEGMNVQGGLVIVMQVMPYPFAPKE